MPSYGMVTTEYLKQILRGDKKLMKMADVRQCNPPGWAGAEASVYWQSVNHCAAPCRRAASPAGN